MWQSCDGDGELWGLLADESLEGKSGWSMESVVREETYHGDD